MIQVRSASRLVSAAMIFLMSSFGVTRGAVASEETGGTTSPFCLGAGGRGIALGGAGAAVWEESYPMLWNPAGLAAVERAGVGLFHTPLLDGSSSYSSVAGSWPFLDLGTISFCVLQLRTGDIERRDSENMVFGNELTERQTRYVIGYGRQVLGGLMAGVNMKLDKFVQGDFSASGFGLDVGLGLRGELDSPIIDGAALGMCLRNLVEPEFIVVSEESGDPRGFRGGIALWRSIAGGFDDRLLVAVDLDKSRYAETTLHAGVEYRAGALSARAGYDDGFPVLGAGFEVRDMSVDYAYKTTDLESYHLFSVSYNYGRSRSEKLEKRRAEREEEIARELAEKTEKYEADLLGGYVRKAREAMDNGSPGAAVTAFNTVLLLEPGNVEAAEGLKMAVAMEHVQTADSLFDGRMYAAAMHEYGLGNKYYNNDKIAERIVLCEKYVREAKDNREMIDKLLAHAIELYTVRNWEDASRAFMEVIKLDPSNEIAGTYYARTLDRRKEEYLSNLQQIERAVSRGQFGQAHELIRSGLQSRPGDKALVEKQSVLENILRSRETAAAEKKAVETKSKVPGTEDAAALRAAYEKGVGHFRNGDFAKAITEWKAVWESWPGFEDVGEYLIKAYQYRGMELYTAHEYEEALNLWRRILEIDPQNEKAIRYIKRTEEEMSRLQRMTG